MTLRANKVPRARHILHGYHTRMCLKTLRRFNFVSLVRQYFLHVGHKLIYFFTIDRSCWNKNVRFTSFFIDRFKQRRWLIRVILSVIQRVETPTERVSPRKFHFCELFLFLKFMKRSQGQNPPVFQSKIITAIFSWNSVFVENWKNIIRKPRKFWGRKKLISKRSNIWLRRITCYLWVKKAAQLFCFFDHHRNY